MSLDRAAKAAMAAHRKKQDKAALREKRLNPFTEEDIDNAVSLMREAMSDPTLSMKDRLTVANNILDRKLGKPHQSTSMEANITHDASSLTDEELLERGKAILKAIG